MNVRERERERESEREREREKSTSLVESVWKNFTGRICLEK
jgi:hypothetical protein